MDGDNRENVPQIKLADLSKKILQKIFIIWVKGNVSLNSTLYNQ